MQPIYFRQEREEYTEFRRTKTGRRLSKKGKQKSELNMTFSIVPRDPKQAELKRRISLRQLKYREVQHLQNVVVKSDFWTNGPEPGLQLIAAEVCPLGVRSYRVDILYLRPNGNVLVTELKIGGKAIEPHGQVLRYLGGLDKLPISRQWVLDMRRKYLTRLYADRDREDSRAFVDVDMLKFEQAIASIPDSGFRLASDAVLIDEGFSQGVIDAAQFLAKFGIRLRLLRLDTLVDDDWNPKSEQFLMRWEFSDMSPAGPIASVAAG